MRQNRDTIYSIGHSNHEIGMFISLLNSNSIDVVADVRSSPYSKYVPQFNKDTLKTALGANGIKYLFLGDELGARPKAISCYVNNKVSFEKLRQSSLFQAGIQKLLQAAHEHIVAMLCSEKNPVVCHRSILISPAIADKGITVKHILEDGSLLSQPQLEKQLLRELHLEPTFFTTEQELIKDAYRIREDKITHSARNQKRENLYVK